MNSGTVEPEAGGMHRPFFNPGQASEPFFAVALSFSAALSKATLPAAQLYAISESYEEALEIEDYATIDALYNILCLSNGIDGRARQQALAAVSRSPVEGVHIDHRGGSWKDRFRPGGRDSQGTIKDISDGGMP